jgi:ATPase family associated with various cellular activities (AAA)
MTSVLAQDIQVASLAESLDRVYSAVRRAARPASDGQAGAAEIEKRPSSIAALSQPCFALQALQALFGLSAFERDVLLLCAGASLESRFLRACADAQGDPQATWPTFGLALAVLDEPHWSAVGLARPLRVWRLIEPSPGGTVLHAPLRIDERILHFLIGAPTVDQRLESLVRPLPALADLDAAGCSAQPAQLVSRAMLHWKRTPGSVEHTKPILLIGNRSFDQQCVFQQICRQTGLLPCVLNGADIPAAAAERDELARLWMRESVLTGSALYVRTAFNESSESMRGLAAWLALVEAPVALEVQPGSACEQIEGLRLHIPVIGTERRKQIWIESLGPAAFQMNGHLDRLVEHFSFDEPSIRLSGLSARNAIMADEACDPGQTAWRICREHARRSLEGLAHRIEPRARWDDMVLPVAQLDTLRQIAVHVRQRGVINEQWGFAAKYARGMGLSALFAGNSGTGKTMAAEILAAELDLDLYQIDLASIVSKYIGETEKNLKKIFDAADESGAVLLFDEADALFGKRSEVRDSHDRYANLEVSYLLQRVESYRGVAILTTNMQHALDPAFMRRIRFIVPFQFPDAPSRCRIWERVFPAAAPLGTINFQRLAQLNVSGGVIRNIATHAAFLAAEEHTAIGMPHVLAAARTEYAKMDKPLTAAETRGWQ